METNVIKLETRSKLTGHVKTEHYVRDFHPFHIDEPVELGGSDTAPNPMEYVLSALNGCETVIMKMIANELSVELDDVSISTVGEIDTRGLKGIDGVRTHFQTIKQKFTFKISSGEEKIEQVITEFKKRCPAYNLVKDANIPVEISYEITPATVQV